MIDFSLLSNNDLYELENCVGSEIERRNITKSGHEDDISAAIDEALDDNHDVIIHSFENDKWSVFRITDKTRYIIEAERKTNND